MTKVCGSCGKPAPLGARYCPSCGHSVETPEAREERRRKTRRTAFIVIGVLAALGLAAGWFGYRAITGLTGVVKEPVLAYLDRLRKGDTEAAYAMTSNAFRGGVTPADYRDYLAARPFLSDMATYSFNSYEWKEGIAHVRGALTSDAGTRTPVEFRLVKENEIWRIYSAERR